MSSKFLNKLDKYRDVIGVPFIVHCAFETTGHAINSQHALAPCSAVDGHFKQRAVSPLDAYIWAERIGFTGIGLYPNGGDWFLHLDYRKVKPSDFRKRWIRDDAGQYHSLNAKSFNDYIGPILKRYEE